MRVGLDCSILSTPLTGIGQYTLSLIQALERVHPEIEFVLLGVAPEVKGLMPESKNFRVEFVGGLRGLLRIAWEQMCLPRDAARTRVDVLHCPDFSRPIWTSVPVVNTIHDLSYFVSAEFSTHGRRIYRKTMCRFAAHNSQKIIAVSNFTRSEIIGRLLIDEKRVVVIHHGVSHTSESNRHDHGPPFLLFIGTHEERKGVTTLIHAYNLLRQQKRIPHRLVCVGKRGFGWRDIQAAYDASPFRAHIELRGYASRDEILRLYQTADLFIYPSVYEGFGLPILEAMACGTPVVCTRAASLPEVAGDAAEYFETSSVEDLAGAIERVLKSREKWAALRERGLERVKMFSWDECARRHCAVYREVAEARKNQTAACTS